jgi:hypothetical protein
MAASPLNRTGMGAAYVIYGGKTLPAALDLDTPLTQVQGMVIQGAVAGDVAGVSVASAGDVNGDSITDLVVGASQASPLNRTNAGAAYVVYGKTFNTTSTSTASSAINPSVTTTLSTSVSSQPNSTTVTSTITQMTEPTSQRSYTCSIG